MPDQNQNNQTKQDQTTSVSASQAPAPDDTTVPTPSIPAPQNDEPDESSLGSLDGAKSSPTLDEPTDTSSVMQEVATKINEANNILVALSANPTVDEMAAAIGLSLCLDQMGKRATAIYSGATPNALEFLKPEETFEVSTDTLQDFVIAINKDKADHLRYKLDGDFVKVYITPYKTRIGEEDLVFSYGDFNIDLTIALDIKSGSDLDQALREQGRVMHDATVINITTDEPGKFGEIEWSDKTASSVSEMIARLIYAMKQKITIDKDEATAFLTGIVSATDRFSKPNTTPATMQIASKLMASGADQQLISENITADTENDVFNLASDAEKPEDDDTSLDIDHEEEGEEDKETSSTPETLDAPKEPTEQPSQEPDVPNEKPEAPTMIETPQLPEVQTPPDLLKPTEVVSEVMPESTPERTEPANVLEALSQTDTTAPAEPNNSNMLDDLKATEAMLSQPSTPENLTPSNNYDTEIKPEKTIAPSEDFVAESLNEGTNKYGQMLEDALAESGITSTPAVTPEMSAPAVGESINPTPIAAPLDNSAPINPAMSSAPEVATNPEINGVPEINYMPLPGDEVLPPPPTPPIDMNTTAPPSPELPSMPPAMQISTPPVATPPTEAPEANNPSSSQPTDPSAFQIPGA